MPSDWKTIALLLKQDPLTYIVRHVDTIGGVITSFRYAYPEAQRRVFRMTRREMAQFLETQGWTHDSPKLYENWRDPEDSNRPHVLTIAVRIAMVRALRVEGIEE